MKTTALSHEQLEFIPERLNEGVLYISERYDIAVHLCCCGCCQEVVTPLTPTDWSVHFANGTVTLDPSIGNWGYSCRSHYWIRRGAVIWARDLDQRQIDRIRFHDRISKEAYYANANRSSIRAWFRSVVGGLKRWLVR